MLTYCFGLNTTSYDLLPSIIIYLKQHLKKKYKLIYIIVKA